MKIKYDGTENCILEIMRNLPGNVKAIRKIGESIIIPTVKGAKQLFIGETVVINGNEVTIIEKW